MMDATPSQHRWYLTIWLEVLWLEEDAGIVTYDCWCRVFDEQLRREHWL